MIYILLEEEPEESLSIKGENFKYIVKARRHVIGDQIQFRSKLNIDTLYLYEITSIENRSVELKLLSKNLEEVSSSKNLHIGWCLIDPKSVEKVLPSLCEIGVERISFILCERSQKNFKLDLKRYNRILESSMQQCGRSTYIEFDQYKNIEEFVVKYPQTKVFDFTDKTIESYENIDTVLIGCEGGFSQKEKELLASKDVFRLDTPMVLRSESATVAVASKILL